MPKTRLRSNCVTKSGHRKVELIVQKWRKAARVRTLAVGVRVKLPLPSGQVAEDESEVET